MGKSTLSPSICVGCADMICFVSGDNVYLGWCNHTDVLHLANEMKEESEICVFKVFITSDEYGNLDILAVQVGACLDDSIIIQVRDDH